MLSETIMQRVIMQTRYNRGYVIPNVTPPGWWECDVFEITRAGYFREYEVKRTVEDFHADAKKAKRARFDWGRPPVKTKTKHDRLASGAWDGPARFFFVTPVGLLDLEEVPVWAGLIEVGMGRRFLRAKVVKRAPQLHKEKFPGKKLDRIKETPYYRMHRLLKTNLYAEADDE